MVVASIDRSLVEFLFSFANGWNQNWDGFPVKSAPIYSARLVLTLGMGFCRFGKDTSLFVFIIVMVLTVG